MTEDEARQRVIRSMCPEKVCQTCGEPSRRIVEVAPTTNGETTFVGRRARGGDRIVYPSETTASTPHFATREAKTLGFSDCGHDDWRPGVWLDPFAELEEA